MARSGHRFADFGMVRRPIKVKNRSPQAPVAPLSFTLSEGNMEILEQLQLNPPEGIPDLAYRLTIEHTDLMRRLEMLAN